MDEYNKADGTTEKNNLGLVESTVLSVVTSHMCWRRRLCSVAMRVVSRNKTLKRGPHYLENSLCELVRCADFQRVMFTVFGLAMANPVAMRLVVV
ncbi:hypothetical protein LR48_Vigan462s000600 [Vigna angularis]|uniref:Uncharacterized protein n=1 Tax=Phaseolus angularis TaxID=3914 RepID=A0A0L9TB25_PHAAN|nr:hypothetical protein LR48_Vigan462s000600 [Vigna angularis]